MKVIHNYPLDLVRTQTINMIAGAKILSVKVQNQSIQLWALVDTGEQSENPRPVEPRTIHIFGTGREIDSSLARLKYIETIQISGDVYVWHVFESRAKKS